MMSGLQNAGQGSSVSATSPPDVANIGTETPPQSPGIVTPPQSPVAVTLPQSPVAVSTDEHNGDSDPEQSGSCDGSDSQSNTVDSQDQDEGHDPQQEAGPDLGQEQDGVHQDAPLFPPPPSEQGTSFNYLQELKSRKMKMKKSTEPAKTSKLLKLLRLRAKYRSPGIRGPGIRGPVSRSSVCRGPVVCDGELEGPQLEAYNEDQFAVSDYADSAYVFSQDTEFIPVPTDSLDLENADIKDPRNHITDTPFHCHLCPVAFASELSLRGHMSCHNLQKKFMCPICTKSFAHSSTLNYHIRKHKGDFRYKCDVCGKKFLKPFRLRAHMMSVHTGEKPYSCTVCGKAFASSINLTRHNRVHTGERPFLCLLCGKRFRDNSSFALHRRYHTQNRKFDCDVCGKTFFKLALLRTHKKCVHAVDRLHPCPLCGKSFKAEEYLRKHKLIHQTDKHYKCDSCDASFSRSGLLKKHQYLHTGEEPHKCQICTKGFRDVYTLSKHMRIHARKARKAAASSLETNEKGETPALLHECDKCGRKYSLPGSLKAHMKKYCKGGVGGEDAPPPDLHCPGCGKLFQHKQSLAKHMKKTCQVLVNKDDRMLLCSDCGLVFANRAELTEHFKTTTCSGCEALRTYKCKVCNAEFSHRMTLSKHKKLHGDIVDDDEKKDDDSEMKPGFPTDEHGRRMFGCKYCLETFRSKSALYDTHMRKCHGRPALCKKNECQFCEKRFHSKSDLRAHTRIHTGEKPFTCGICGKSFTQRGHVSMHMKIHTGQRDFPCTICGKAFQFATTLRNHVKLHTGERPHVCPVCGKGFIKSNNLKNHLSRHAKRGQLIKQESMEDGQPVMALNQDDLSVMVSPTKFTMMGSLTVRLKKPKKTRRSSRARKGQAMKKLIEEEMNPVDQFDDEMPEIKVEPIEYPEGEEEFNTEDQSRLNHSPVKSPEGNHSNGEHSDEEHAEESKSLEDVDENLELGNDTDYSDYDGEEEEDGSLIKDEDLDLTCPLCQRTFASQYHLGVHIKTHTGSRPFKCQDCGRSFLQSSHLRSHTQVHGRSKQDYRCLVCTEGFHTVKLLHVHMKVHKGERPYGCYFCEKTYGISQHLRRHVRMVHPDKIDVDMNLLHMPSSALNDGFGHRVELDEHGRRIFRCYLCNKFYFKSQHLNRHQRSSHADTLTVQDSVSGISPSLEESLNGNLQIKREIMYDPDSESGDSSGDNTEDDYGTPESLKSGNGKTTKEQFRLPPENFEDDSDKSNSSDSEGDVEGKFDNIEIKKENSDSEYEAKLTA